MPFPAPDSTLAKVVDAPFTVADTERLNQLVRFYESFAVNNQQEVELIKKIAVAKGKIGNICLQLGRWDSAEKTFEDTIYWIEEHQEATQKLSRQKQTEIMIFYSSILNQLGRVNYWKGEIDKAKDYHHQAVASFNSLMTLAESEEQKTEIAFQLAATQLSLGTVRTSRNTQFIQLRRRQNLNRSRFNKKTNNNRKVDNRRKAVERFLWRNPTVDPEEIKECTEWIRLATNGLTKLKKKHPDNMEFYFGLAKCYLNLAMIRSEENKGRFAGLQSSSQFRKALKIFAELEKKHPEQVAYQFEYANALAKSRKLVTSNNANANLLEAQLIVKKLRKRFPTNFQFHLLFSSIQSELGEIATNQKNWSDAENHFLSSSKTLKELSLELSDPSALSVPIARIDLRLAQLWMNPKFYSVHSTANPDPINLLDSVRKRLLALRDENGNLDRIQADLLSQTYLGLSQSYQRDRRPAKAKWARDEAATWKKQSVDNFDELRKELEQLFKGKRRSQPKKLEKWR